MKKEVERIKEILGSLKDEIEEKYKAEVVGIFCSYVRGEQKKGVTLMFL